MWVDDRFPCGGISSTLPLLKLPELACLEAPVGSIIATVILLVECKQDNGAIDLFLRFGSDMAAIRVKRRLLSKPREPSARVLDIGVDFCITESNELPSVGPGEERFSRHASQSDCVEKKHRPLLSRST